MAPGRDLRLREKSPDVSKLALIWIKEGRSAFWLIQFRIGLPGANSMGKFGKDAMPNLYRDAEAVRAELGAKLDQLSAICERLERVADGLPENVDRADCLELSRTIYPTMVKSHHFEEKVVFPLLRMTYPDPSIADTLERLRFEHWEDESFAAELQETLCGFVNGRERDRVDTLAWMLRGFFEGLRRHIAFEREHMMPMLSRAHA
jgi:iron-sulfur cluster repair protein YtfE (RIC family)